METVNDLMNNCYAVLSLPYGLSIHNKNESHLDVIYRTTGSLSIDCRKCIIDSNINYAFDAKHVKNRDGKISRKTIYLCTGNTIIKKFDVEVDIYGNNYADVLIHKMRHITSSKKENIKQFNLMVIV